MNMIKQIHELENIYLNENELLEFVTKCSLKKFYKLKISLLYNKGSISKRIRAHFYNLSKSVS